MIKELKRVGPDGPGDEAHEGQATMTLINNHIDSEAAKAKIEELKVELQAIYNAADRDYDMIWAKMSANTDMDPVEWTALQEQMNAAIQIMLLAQAAGAKRFTV
jgi:hypothetical protein